MTRQSFMKGTFILVVSGLIAKILGMVPQIILPRMIGAEGWGLFRMSFPLLLFAISLSIFGLNITLSKLVAEAQAKRDFTGVASLVQLSTRFVFFLSCTVTLCLFLATPWISTYLLTDQRALYPMLAMLPIIPIIAISNVYRGYFQGLHNMIPTAISQMVEAFIRIFTVIGLALYALPYGIEKAAAAAMLGMIIGEITSYLVLRGYMKRSGIFQKELYAKTIWNGDSKKMLLRRMARISIPVTSSSLIARFLMAAEPILVAQSLAMAGIAVSSATTYYGQLAMAITILYIPSFLTYSLSTSMIPAISAADAKKNRRLIQRRLHQGIRICLVIVAPASVIFYVLSEPLALLIYNDQAVGVLLRQMSLFFILLYLQYPLQATLQGLDLAKNAMINSIVGAVVRSLLIFLLASQPHLGIDGVTYAYNISIALITVLHFISLMQAIEYRIEWVLFSKVALNLSLLALFMQLFMRIGKIDDFSPLRLLLFITIASIFYLFISILFKMIGAQDIRRIPRIGPRLAAFFPRR
ncbi:stage V sporulation protein B [Rubeoparvulum massiliense]|uniref:stage V sporulation protein B n=1 Tax=Rubeoparvulum massiliense TaxID=1631346 RepID=UPI00065DD83D|nr:stage V sporulation protein B [Rubeoparvulum massiliense]